MKITTPKLLRRKCGSPANPLSSAIQGKLSSSIAALSSLGVGLAFFRAGSKSSLFRSDGKKSGTQVKKDYFHPAPRAITGSHRSYREYAGRDNDRLLRMSGLFFLGSAALIA
jgi:hypothetical protein